MTKEINLIDKIDNGDGTQIVHAYFSIFEDDGQTHLACRAIFTFDISMTDSDIINWLINNDFKQYNDY